MMDPDELDARAILFGEHDPRQFLAEHWNRAWIKMHAGAERLRRVFSRDDLTKEAMGRFDAGAQTIGVRASYVDAAGKGRMFPAPLEMARALYDAGMTLAFDDLQLTHARLRALTTAAAKLLGAMGPVSIGCFLSPDGHGLPWHIDCVHVFVLQLEGDKRWQLGAARVEAAPFHLQADTPNTPAVEELFAAVKMQYARFPEDAPEEVQLAPGDVLYLPPGTWHRAFAQGSSLHLSLLVRPVSFARLLRAALTLSGLRQLDWRQDLQLVGSGAAASRAELLRLLEARLTEARRELAQLTPERLAQLMDALTASPLLRDVLLNRAAKDVL